MNLNSSVSSVTDSSPGCLAGMPLRASWSMSFWVRKGRGPVCFPGSGPVFPVSGPVFPDSAPCSAPPGMPAGGEAGEVFGRVISSLSPNFFGMGTACGGRGFSRTTERGTDCGGTGRAGSGCRRGGSCLTSCCGRLTILTGVYWGAGGAGSARNKADATTSAWSAREKRKNFVKCKYRGMYVMKKLWTQIYADKRGCNHFSKDTFSTLNLCLYPGLSDFICVQFIVF